MLIIVDPPRNAIEFIFGKSNDYSCAMRVPKYFAEECGFHLGFDGSFKLIGICLPRHQIRLSLLEELSQLGGEEVSWDDQKVEAKIRSEMKVTKMDNWLIIRFTNQIDRYFPITNRSSKYPIFAILTEENGFLFGTEKQTGMLNGFAIPLKILPDEWLEEIDVVSGADCLKDPCSDFEGYPALPEKKREEFFGFKNNSLQTPEPKTESKDWNQKPVPPYSFADFEGRPPPSRAFKKPRPLILVLSPRVEVLAKARDGSGVETEVYIFNENKQEVLVDRGNTVARLGGWWRSKVLSPGKYKVMTLLTVNEEMYWDIICIELLLEDVSLKSGPIWTKADADRLTNPDFSSKNRKMSSQKLSVNVLEGGKKVCVLDTIDHSYDLTDKKSVGVKTDKSVDEKVVNRQTEYSASAWFWKGRTYRELGKNLEALECFNSAIDLDQNNSNYWLYKGSTLNRLERYEQAIECYERAIELKPENSINFFMKGVALHNLERYEEAIDCYDKALRLEPKDAATLSRKGDSLRCLKRYGEAMKCYDRVIELEGGKPEIRTNNEPISREKEKRNRQEKYLENRRQRLPKETYSQIKRFFSNFSTVIEPDIDQPYDFLCYRTVPSVDKEKNMPTLSKIIVVGSKHLGYNVQIRRTEFGLEVQSECLQNWLEGTDPCFIALYDEANEQLYWISIEDNRKQLIQSLMESFDEENWAYLKLDIIRKLAFQDQNLDFAKKISENVNSIIEQLENGKRSLNIFGCQVCGKRFTNPDFTQDEDLKTKTVKCKCGATIIVESETDKTAEIEGL